MSSDTLADICAVKQEHILACKARKTEMDLHAELSQVESPRGFLNALQQSNARGNVGLIAEVKKASPSKGLIRENFDPAAIAKAYQQGGASCISVLTDEPYFQGKDIYLQQVKQAVSLPVLRKDFMLDPYQITEARALGADCILLIMAALDDLQARELESAAFALGMDVLVEIHNLEELERALELKSRLIGINNRNLKTLQVDLATSENLVTHIPDGYTIVCESGVASHDDIARMQRVNIQNFLVGESLMRQENIVNATRTLLGAF